MIKKREKSILEDIHLQKKKGFRLDTCWAKKKEIICKNQMKVEIANNVSGTRLEILDYSIGRVWTRTLSPSCHPLSSCQRIWRDTVWPQVSV